MHTYCTHVYDQHTDTSYVCVCIAAVASQGAQAALDRYQTSIDEDLALLRSGGVTPGSPEEQAIRVSAV